MSDEMNGRIKYWLRAIDEEAKRVDERWFPFRLMSWNFRTALVDLRTALYELEAAPKPAHDTIVPQYQEPPTDIPPETVPDKRPATRRVVKRNGK